MEMAMAPHREQPQEQEHGRRRSGASSPVEGAFSEEELGDAFSSDEEEEEEEEEGEEEEEEDEEERIQEQLRADQVQQRGWFDHRRGAASASASAAPAAASDEEDDAHLVAAAALRQRWYTPSSQPHHLEMAAAAHAQQFQARVAAAAAPSGASLSAAHAQRYDVQPHSHAHAHAHAAYHQQAAARAVMASQPSQPAQHSAPPLHHQPLVRDPHHSRSGGSNHSSSGGASALEDLLRCFICYGRVRQAHLCPACGKVGCLQCYSSWIGQGKAECPFCRRALTIDRLVNCRFMTDLTAALSDIGVVKEDGSCVSPARHGSAAAAAAGFAAAGHAACSAHPSQPMSYYCRTCSTALCSDCCLFDSASSSSSGGSGGHRGHELAKLDAVYADHASRVGSERDKVAARLQALRARADGVQRNASLLARRKEERSADLRSRAVQLEAVLAGELRRKLAVLQSQRREIGNESDLLASLLSELHAQLDPAVLPKHQLIEKSTELIDMLRELHCRPLWPESGDGPVRAAAAAAVEGGAAAVAASVAAAVVGAEPRHADADVDGGGGEPAQAPLRFTDELVPQWRASSLVRVGSFVSKRRAAQAEEEMLRACKLRLAGELAIERAHSDEEEHASAPPQLPTPVHEVWYSAPLWAHGQCWRLKLYPNGNGQAKPNYVSLFVELTHSHLHQQAPHSQDESDGDEGEEEEKGEHAGCGRGHSDEEEGDRDDEAHGLHVPDSPFPLPEHEGCSRGPAFAPRGLPAAAAAGGAAAGSYSNRYEYRVELLPHPHHYPELAPHLTVAMLQSSGSGSSGGDDPLSGLTVGEYLESLLFAHAHDAPLCAALHAYSSRIVSRVFESSFEHGEAWSRSHAGGYPQRLSVRKCFRIAELDLTFCLFIFASVFLFVFSGATIAFFAVINWAPRAISARHRAPQEQYRVPARRPRTTATTRSCCFGFTSARRRSTCSPSNRACGSSSWRRTRAARPDDCDDCSDDCAGNNRRAPLGSPLRTAEHEEPCRLRTRPCLLLHLPPLRRQSPQLRGFPLPRRHAWPVPSRHPPPR